MKFVASIWSSPIVIYNEKGNASYIKPLYTRASMIERLNFEQNLKREKIWRERIKKKFVFV